MTAMQTGRGTDRQFCVVVGCDIIPRQSKVIILIHQTDINPRRTWLTMIAINTSARDCIRRKCAYYGIILLFIAVFSEVAHASLTKSLLETYTSQNIVMYQFMIGALYLLPLFIWKGLEDFDPSLYLSAEVWTPILCLAILCSSAAFTLWVSTLKTLGVARSSIFSALIPVVSALIAWVIGREVLTTRQWTGIAIAVLGVILSQYVSKEAR